MCVKTVAHTAMAALSLLTMMPALFALLINSSSVLIRVVLSAMLTSILMPPISASVSFTVIT